MILKNPNPRKKNLPILTSSIAIYFRFGRKKSLPTYLHPASCILHPSSALPFLLLLLLYTTNPASASKPALVSIIYRRQLRIECASVDLSPSTLSRFCFIAAAVLEISCLFLSFFPAKFDLFAFQKVCSKFSISEFNFQIVNIRY